MHYNTCLTWTRQEEEEGFEAHTRNFDYLPSIDVALSSDRALVLLL